MSADEPILARLQRYLDDTRNHTIPSEYKMSVHMAAVEAFVLQEQAEPAIEELEKLVQECPLYAFNPSVVRVGRSARFTIRDVGRMQQEAND